MQITLEFDRLCKIVHTAKMLQTRLTSSLPPPLRVGASPVTVTPCILSASPSLAPETGPGRAQPGGPAFGPPRGARHPIRYSSGSPTAAPVTSAHYSSQISHSLSPFFERVYCSALILFWSNDFSLAPSVAVTDAAFQALAIRGISGGAVCADERRHTHTHTHTKKG